MVEMKLTKLANEGLNQRMVKSSSLPEALKNLINVDKKAKERAMRRQSGKDAIQYKLCEQQVNLKMEETHKGQS